MARICKLCTDPRRAEIERRMAAGETDGPLAKDYGYQSQQVAIHRLKHMPTSPARMTGAALQAYNQAITHLAITSKAERLTKLQHAADRLERIMEERAREYAHLVGGSSGLLVPKKRSIGTGDTTEIVEDEVFDVYVLREYRSTLEQAAKECGEWDITGAGGREDAATGAASVTIQQVIHGNSAIAVSADPRPGSRQLTAPKPSLSLHSPQSVGGVEAVDATGTGAAVRVDEAGGEG